MTEANGTNKIPYWVMKQRQQLPLFAKVEMTKKRIREWCDHWDDMVYVAFSGGLDSTVLLHLVRQVLPDCPAVFADTGLEFPEIKDFVKTIPGVVVVRPEKTFPQVLKEDGYPVISKETSLHLSQVQRAKTDPGLAASARLRMEGIRKDGTRADLGEIPDKWKYLADAPFKISHKCCDYFKKKPFDRYFKDTGRIPFIGSRAEEGRLRERKYMQLGCNGYGGAKPSSTPLSFWLHQDVSDYIRQHDIPYSKIYDMGYDRTGCMFCMYGCHMETGKNRFQIMEETHPKLHKYCMEKLGLKEVLEYIGVAWENRQLELFND